MEKVKELKTKALVLFSGGLDSRLAIKLLQEQNLEVEALFVKLPFGGGCCNNSNAPFNFSQISGVKFHVIDASQGKLLQKYLRIIKTPKYGRGTSYNPCKDCKIFLFKEAKQLAKKIGAEIIATGEVLGQRPMSQMKKDLEIYEEEAGLKGRILRPLSAKLLPLTIYEEKGLIERANLLSIKGRERKKQMALARKYKINYPNPGGGCLLCEKVLKNRFKILLKRGLNEEEAKLINVGRHFRIGKTWIVIGRDEMENKILEFMKKGVLVKPDFPAPSARVFGKISKSKVIELIEAYSKKGNLGNRKRWEEYKL